MDLQVNSNTVLVFDLDDTLYAEIDFLKSAYRGIVKTHFENNQEVFRIMLAQYLDRKNPFRYLEETFSEKEITVNSLIDEYRNHYPQIRLYEDAHQFLMETKSHNLRTGLITDGRSITQRNKLKALGLDNFFDCLVISGEMGTTKPEEKNYRMIADFFNCNDCIYFGDNPDKDFITPNRLGWKSICLLDRGSNIHYQKFDLPEEYLPQFSIQDFSSVRLLVSHA